MTRTTTGDRRAEAEPGRIAPRLSVALAAGRAVGWSLFSAMWVSCAAALTSGALLGLAIWATRNEPPESMIGIVYWAIAIYGTVLAYLIWAVVALVKAPAGRRRAVLIGIVLVPAAMISYSSIAARLDDRRQEQARVVIGDLPSTYMVEGVGAPRERGPVPMAGGCGRTYGCTGRNLASGCV